MSYHKEKGDDISVLKFAATEPKVIAGDKSKILEIGITNVLAKGISSCHFTGQYRLDCQNLLYGLVSGGFVANSGSLSCLVRDDVP